VLVKSHVQYVIRQWCLCFSLLMANSVCAETWKIEPAISATETYTDNVTLSSEDKNSEFISQINPGFSVSAKGRRIKLNGRYSLSYINYWDATYSDRYVNQGGLSANFEFVKRHLDVDAAVAVSEQVIDPTKVTAFDEQAVTNNRTETRSVLLSPTLKNRFGRYADSLLAYQHSRVGYSTKQINSSYDNLLKYSLSSGKWFKQLAWSGNALIQSSKQKNSNKSQVNGRLEYSVVRKWKLFMTGHLQKRNYMITGFKDSRYFVKNEIGLVWTPTRKVYLEAGGGVVLNSQALSQNTLDIEQRIWRAKIVVNPTSRTLFEIGREQAIFGQRIYSNFKHYTKKTIWSSTYTETIVTPQQSRYIADFEAKAENVNSDDISELSELNRLISNDVILRKRLDTSGKIKRKKLNLIGSVFYEKGEYQTIKKIDNRYGINGILEFDLSNLSSAFVNSAVQRYRFDEQSRIDNIVMIKTGFSRNIGKNMKASLIYSLQKRSVNSGGVAYTSNKLVAQINLAL